ncbi:MAG: hypothetical protein QOD06_2849 [Candidatus Binatota bacterium]|nr:hypothetical protein [Candidatus Binatota bacterium]
MAGLRFAAFTAVLVTLTASAPLGLAQPAPPTNLPVVFEVDDPRDGSYEAGTDALAQAHFAENVPIAILAVPCGPGSTLSPYKCATNTYHQRYRDWILQHPGLVEIGLHGLFHTEHFGELTRAEQLDMVTKGLQQMQTWNLPAGRPYAFAPPFASENADTISVLEQLGFKTSIRNSDTCIPSAKMDTFCESIALCARDANGNRVAGPSCVLLSPQTVMDQVNARQGDGKVFVVYHVQDLMLPDLVTVDSAKITKLRAILKAFRNEEIAGHYRLMTFEEHRGTPPPPTPAPNADEWVYQDFLSPPWTDESWSTTVNFQNTSPVFRGTRSIKVVETGWGALSLHKGAWGSPKSIDPRNVQALQVVVHGGTSGFTVAGRLENEAGDVFPEVVLGTIPANQWVSLSASMARLNPSAKLFDRFDIYDRNGIDRTYYVDDVLLVGSASSGTPTPTRTRTPVPPTRTPTRAPTRTSTPKPPTAATATPTRTPTRAVTVAPTRTPTKAAAPTPTRVPDKWMYQDAIVAPWINASWSATVDFANPSPVFAGTRSIKVVETGWGALSFHHGAWSATQTVDPNRYGSLRFQIYASGSGFAPSVRLENDAGQAFPSVTAASVPANQWATVSVPMTSLDPSKLPFARVDIGDSAGVSRTYYVDDLRLVGK